MPRHEPGPRSGQRRTIDRYLSRAGVASRTEAARLVEQGRVAVNGRVVAEPGAWIDPRVDRVTVDGRPVRQGPRRRELFLYNKPRGLLVTERDPEGRDTVRQSLPPELRERTDLRPVGRLDRATGGLLLFTNDNDLAARILNREQHLMKFYRIKLQPAPSAAALHRLRAGLDIGDPERTAPANVHVERTGPRSAVLRIGIIEGRNRQLRRMAEAIDCEVEWLIRSAIGPLELGDLEVGAVRRATRSELETLEALADL